MSLDDLIKSTHPSVSFLKRDHEISELNFVKSVGGAIDDLGNPTGQELLKVLTHLYVVTTLESAINSSQNQQSKVYKGHAIDPKFLPAWIVPGAGGKCLLGDREYDFTLLAVDRTAMPAYSKHFGERLEITIFSSSKSF